MATNFPTSLDNSTSLPYPSSGNFTNAPSLAGLNDNQNDALIATQTKLGIGASTPTSGKFLTGTGIGTSAWANTVPAGTVVGTSDSQTLTNKTLTSPTISSPVITNATITTDLITGYTTSNTGTVYGIPITTGVINTAGTINGASLVANSITNASILTGNLYASKFYNPYKCRYYLSADQSVSAGFVNQRIIFNTKTYDTSSNFNTGTGFFTAPIAGFYCIQSSVRILNGASSNEVDFNIQVNSFTTSTSIRTAEAASGTYSYILNDVQQLSANDTVSISFSGGSAGTVRGSTSATFITVFLVSAT